jgi:hypothetical protein
MTLSIGGGRVGDLVVEADASTAPDITKLVSAESLLVAGENKTLPELGTFLDPYFVYLVDANGQATSLLESATTETNTESFPRFAMSDFRQALASRK